MLRTGLLVALLITLLPTSGLARTPAVLEVTTNDGKTVVGKLAAMDKVICWIMDDAGELHRLAVRNITGSKKVANEFKPLTAEELRTRFAQEYGRKYETISTPNYVIVAAPGQARTFGRVFDDVYRSFDHYFRTRGFELSKPEFPMVGIVFPTREAFYAYARKDGMTPFPGLRGYYNQLTNRIVLFDADSEVISGWDRRRARVMPPDHIQLNADSPKQEAGRTSGHHDAAVSGGVIDTLIHEATHQIAYNVGLHSRFGQNPKWVVEGLATVFEAEGIRNRNAGRTLAARINTSRYRWFQSYRDSRRVGKSIGSFVANDALFHAKILDAYSESWALTFYLIERRPADYAKLLKQIRARDPLKLYTEKQRLADVQAALGNDLAWLEVQYLRFYEGLAATQPNLVSGR